MSENCDVKGLIKSLSSGGVHREAAFALENMGKAAVGPLIEALNDSCWEVRGNAAWVLGRIGDSRAIKPLIDLLRDDVWEVRVEAGIALVMMGRQSIEPLRSALKDDSLKVRKLAYNALSVLCGIENGDQKEQHGMSDSGTVSS